MTYPEVILTVLSAKGIPQALELTNEIELSFSQAKRPEWTIDRKCHNAISAACYVMSVNPDAITSKSRVGDLVWARQMAMVILRNETNLSLKRVGIKFGNRDHSTVINAIHIVEDMVATNRERRCQFEQVYARYRMMDSYL